MKTILYYEDYPKSIKEFPVLCNTFEKRADLLYDKISGVVSLFPSHLDKDLWKEAITILDKRISWSGSQYSAKSRLEPRGFHR